MSNFLSQWKSFLTEELLIESRYTVALAFAQNLKKASRTGRVADVYQKMSDEDIDLIKDGLRRGIEYLQEADPTGDNQYLMWAARNLRAEATRFLQKFSDRWGTNPDDWSNYLNTGKTAAAAVAERVVSRALGLSNRLRDYHLLKSKNLIKKDLQDYDAADYDAFHRWQSDVGKGMQDFSEREEREKLKVTAKELSDTIMEDEDYQVVRPYSKQASCYFGYGSKWCIAATRFTNYFDRYTEEGKAFYFVMLRHLPNRDPSKKLALVYSSDIGPGDEPEEVWDEPNDEVGTTGLYDAVTRNLLAKVVKNLTANKEDVAKIKKMDTDKQIQWVNILSDAAAVVISGEEEDADETREEILDILGLRQRGFDVDDLMDGFEELVQEEYQNIIDETSSHAMAHPAGPSAADWQVVADEYNTQMSHSSVHFEDYDGDGATFYFSGDMGINMSEESLGIELDPDADPGEVLDVVRKVLDIGFSIFPEELDFYDGENISVRFSPDYDEAGLDGFKEFADRISEADEEYDNIIVAIAKAIASAGFVKGGINFADVEAELEAQNLQHAEVDESDGELAISFPLQFRINLRTHPIHTFTDRPNRDPNRVEAPGFIDWFHQDFFGSEGRMQQSIEGMLRKIWNRLAKEAQRQIELPLDERMSSEDAVKFFYMHPPQFEFGDVEVKWAGEPDGGSLTDVYLKATLAVIVPVTATEDYANAVVAYSKYIDDHYAEIEEVIDNQLLHDVEQQLATIKKEPEQVAERYIKQVIKQEVKRYLTEQEGLNIYQTYAIILTDDDINITDVLTKMRAIEGVTVISTDETVEDGDRNRHEVRIKYLKKGKSVAHYVSLLKRSTSRIPGVRRFRIISTKKINI